MDAALLAAPPSMSIATVVAVFIAIFVYYSLPVPGRVRARLRKSTRGHVRRVAARFHFSGADVGEVDVDVGEVVFGGDCTPIPARNVRVVESGIHLKGGRVVKVRVEVAGGGASGGSDSAGGSVRTLNFPSRRAAEAFMDALIHAQGKEDNLRPEEITLSLNTWNVGNAQPQTELGSWFDRARDAHVIVFATQECWYKVNGTEGGGGSGNRAGGGVGGSDDAFGGGGTFSSGEELGADEEDAPLLQESRGAGVSSADLMMMDPELAANSLSGQKHWLAVVHAHFPQSEYATVAEISSWDRCLSVYVRNNIAGAVSDVTSDSSFVGLGGVAGNKGAIGVRFKVFETDFVFVNSHLAAHQGNVVRRNQDYSSITAGLKALRDGPQTDFMTSPVHHVFWMGDLNYRIDLDVCFSRIYVKCSIPMCR